MATATTDKKLAAYFLMRDSDRLMRRRHHDYGKDDCGLDLPRAVRAARMAFRESDRKRWSM